jgi:hypothetical protein
VRFAGAVLLPLAFLACASARADVVYFTNLDQSIDDLAPINTTANFTLAQSFLTDSSSTLFVLDNVTLLMGDATATGGNFQVSIWANTDSGPNLPNFPVAVLSGSADPATAGNYVYNGSDLALAPDTLYWVVATVTAGPGNYNWAFTSSLTTTGPWTTLGWSEIDTNTTPNWQPILNNLPQLMSISATAVPEPSATAALLGTAAFGLVFFRRRQISGGL